MQPDVFPQPKAGWDAMWKLIKKNIKYPAEAKEHNITGKVFVRFDVNENGKISNPRVASAKNIDGEMIKKLGYGCDEEALRLTNILPEWEPAESKGKPVKFSQVMTYFFGDRNKWKMAYPKGVVLLSVNDDEKKDKTPGLKIPVIPQSAKDRREAIKDRREAIKEKYPSPTEEYGDIMTFVRKNVEYPEAARKKGISGKVVVSFIVGVDGKLKNVEIQRSVDPVLDKEALRVVNMIKDWVPGEVKGVKKDIQLYIPIDFKLD